MSDRIAVMNEGKIEQFDIPTNIYEKPASKFISGFIGVSNYFECTVIGKEEPYVIGETRFGSTLYIHVNSFNAQPEERDVIVVAVRPEKIKIHNQKPDQVNNIFAAVVTHIVYLGSMTYYYLQTENNDEVIVHEQNMDLFGGQNRFERGNQVFIHWLPEASRVVAS